MKFDILHTARQGQAFGPRPGLPAVEASRRIATAIGIASLIVLFVLAFVDLALTAPALARMQPAYAQATHVLSGGKS